MEQERSFKTKVNHCKRNGAARFDIEKLIVKVQIKIRANDPSQGLCKRPGADSHLRQEGSPNLSFSKSQRQAVGESKVFINKE